MTRGSARPSSGSRPRSAARARSPRRPACDRDRLDHVQFGDRLADLGIVDRREGGADRSFGRVGSRPRWYVAPEAIPSDAMTGVTPDAPAPDPADWRVAVWRCFLRAHAAVIRELERELDTDAAHAAGLVRRAAQLARRPERRLRMAELADRVLLSRSGLTRLVDRLERRGAGAPRAVARRRPRHVHGADPAGLRRLRDAVPVHWPACSGTGSRTSTTTSCARSAQLLARIDADASERAGCRPGAAVVRDSLGVGVAVGRLRVRVRRGVGGGRAVGAADLPALAARVHRRHPVRGRRGGRRRRHAGGGAGAAGCCSARATRCTRCGWRRCCGCAARAGCWPRWARSTSRRRWPSAQHDEPLARVAFWWTFGGVFTFWNLSTLLGAAGASAIGDPAEVRAGRGGPGRLPRAARAAAARRADRAADRARRRGDRVRR